jgi:hypothetical protein
MGVHVAKNRREPVVTVERAVRAGFVIASYSFAFAWAFDATWRPSIALALILGTSLATLCVTAQPQQIPLIATVAAGAIIGGAAYGSFDFWIGKGWIGNVREPYNAVAESEGCFIFVGRGLSLAVGGLVAGVLYRCVSRIAH